VPELVAILIAILLAFILIGSTIYFISIEISSFTDKMHLLKL